MPANFRTEEGMRRLLTAVIAAHDVKLNYKAISKHYGSDWTESGIEHFFRPLKKNATSIRKMVDRDEDAANFNHNAWQFRQIKRDAEAMKQGKGASDTTPTATPAATPKSSRKRSAVSAPSTGKSTAKKARGNAAKSTDNHVINLDDDDSEYSPVQTPTKSRKVKVDYDNGRETYTKMGFDYAPSLDLTQADSPHNDEDIKPITPGDAPSYSFAQPTQQTAGGDNWTMWGNNSFGGGNAHLSNSSGPQKSYVADEFDDELSV
ncbi:hypothetical protein VP1G_07274 [Cytospora mali]|uniref:Uncharacterized protein n=1 Tax=Cytospora mali TaxID=578113 RepID=A0A194V7T3_CYTMA|nr:hypothetical protein VP1G_07274 [Valsa mali var. pyri (nom. inval.)]